MKFIRELLEEQDSLVEVKELFSRLKSAFTFDSMLDEGSLVVDSHEMEFRVNYQFKENVPKASDFKAYKGLNIHALHAEPKSLTPKPKKQTLLKSIEMQRDKGNKSFIDVYYYVEFSRELTHEEMKWLRQEILKTEGY